uniref:Uncharacterized protein n=1 Tax=Octopus bimaculoides TaxID=37653 RepID=A0A0L8GGN7_OCTBM
MLFLLSVVDKIITKYVLGSGSVVHLLLQTFLSLLCQHKQIIGYTNIYRCQL